jgi:putative transposase
MTRLEERRTLVNHIAQARADGARLSPACVLAGIDARTLQRWKAGTGLARGDRRPDADRSVPPHVVTAFASVRQAIVRSARSGLRKKPDISAV